MITKSIPVAGGLLAAMLTSAWAQGVPITAAEQQLRLEQERLRQEQERTRPVQAPSGVDLEAVQPVVPMAQPQGPCSDIQTVRLTGAHALGADEQALLTDDFSGRCLSAVDIQRVLGAVTKHYIDRGFITARAYLPAQDLRSGELRILVQEGRIERMEVRGDDARRINAGLASPVREGDVLNIRDLEQMVDQLNAVRGNKVKLDLLPGSAPGQTVVVLSNTAASPLGLLVSMDNMGSKATGRGSISATVVAGSLWRTNETIGLTLRSTVPHTREQSAHSASLVYSLPLGHWTLGLNLAESRFSTGFILQYPSGGVQSYVAGRSTTYGLSVDRVLRRDQASLHKAVFELSKVDTKNYFEQPQSGVSQFLAANSRQSSVATLGVRSMWLLPNAMFTLAPQLTFGVADKSYLQGINSARQGSAHFSKYTLGATFSQGFQVGGQDMAWNSEFRGQYSPDKLLAVHQMLIGGPPSVRGYLDSSLSGESGYVWRNDVALKKQFQVGADTVQARFYAGYDVGQVRNHDAGAFEGRMSGLALGVAAQWRRVDMDVSWNRPVDRPAWMARETSRVLVRLTYRY